MAITSLKRSAADHVADYAAGKNTESRKQKSDLFHVRYLTKVAVLSLAFIAATALPAQAHTRLVSSNPAQDATVETFPTEISLTFNEDLMSIGGKQVSKFNVLDPERKDVKLGALSVSKSTISGPVEQQDIKAGTYKIYYRVISADGHPVSGFISFNNQSVSAAYTAEPETSATTDSIQHWIVHHKWHILETAAALTLILAWAIYRRRNKD